MSTQSALEEISNLNARIESLKQQAVSEIASKIAEKKAEIRALEADYEQITGKTVTGERRAAAQEPGTRMRLTREEKNALPERITKALSGGALSLGQLMTALGEDVPKSAVKAVLAASKQFRMSGSRASAKYSVQ